MNVYRLIAAGVTTCAAGLSLAACSLGVTTARAPASPSPVDTVSVDGPIGSFPVPPGTQLLISNTCGNGVVIDLGSVAPARVSAFYASALPRAGYKITGNSLGTDPATGIPDGIAQLEFTGHGYHGMIVATANPALQASSLPVPRSLYMNSLEISLTPPGQASALSC